MNQETLPALKAGDADLMELGFALGQSHTFGLVAGRCSTAQAQGIADSASCDSELLITPVDIPGRYAFTMQVSVSEVDQPVKAQPDNWNVTLRITGAIARTVLFASCNSTVCDGRRSA